MLEILLEVFLVDSISLRFAAEPLFYSGWDFKFGDRIFLTSYENFSDFGFEDFVVDLKVTYGLGLSDFTLL